MIPQQIISLLVKYVIRKTEFNITLKIQQMCLYTVYLCWVSPMISNNLPVEDIWKIQAKEKSP